MAKACGNPSLHRHGYESGPALAQALVGSCHAISRLELWRYFRFVVFPSVYLDLAPLGFMGLGQMDLEDSILELGVGVVHLQLSGETNCAAEGAVSDLGANQLALLHCLLPPVLTFDAQLPVGKVHFQILLVHTRNLCTHKDLLLPVDQVDPRCPQVEGLIEPGLSGPQLAKRPQPPAMKQGVEHLVQLVEDIDLATRQHLCQLSAPCLHDSPPFSGSPQKT